MNIALLDLRKYNRFEKLNNTPLEKERRTMNKTIIKCPRCNSDKLYKFGLNKQAKQKYKFKNCKRQFALGDGDGLPEMNYPNVLSVVKVLIYIMHTNTITVINVITKNIIILLSIITISILTLFLVKLLPIPFL